MTSEPPSHELLRVETVAGRGCRSCCSCGWSSVVATSAGVAGALWDEHVAEHEA